MYYYLINIHDVTDNIHTQENKLYTAVNEASKHVAPLAETITNISWNMISKACSLVEKLKSNSNQKELLKLAEEMKNEYPYETVEYIAYLLKNQYGALK